MRLNWRIRARTVGRVRVRDDQRVVLRNARLRGADFSGRKLVQFASVGSRLEECRLDGVRVEDGSFGAGRETSEYVKCTFDGARMTFGPGGYARFIGCSFKDVDLRDWFCHCVELIDCSFSGRMRRSFFNGTVPEDDRSVARRERNEFRGNDFSHVDLVDVDFRTGIDLTQQRLPSGPEYLFVPDAAAAVQRARAEVVRWEDLELRQQAIPFLKTLEDAVEGGQKQLLLRADDYSPRRREAIDRVFALL